MAGQNSSSESSSSKSTTTAIDERHLLKFYQKKFEEYQTRDDKYREKIDRHLKNLVTDRHELEEEVLRRGEKISDLQKALVELQLNVFEERERFLKVSAENEELKRNEEQLHKNIRELLAMTHQKDLQDKIIYILKDPTVEIGYRTEHTAESKSVDNAANKKLKEELEYLQKQLDEVLKISRSRSDVVLEDCKQALEKSKEKIMQDAIQIRELQKKLQDLGVQKPSSPRTVPTETQFVKPASSVDSLSNICSHFKDMHLTFILLLKVISKVSNILISIQATKLYHRIANIPKAPSDMQHIVLEDDILQLETSLRRCTRITFDISNMHKSLIKYVSNNKNRIQDISVLRSELKYLGDMLKQMTILTAENDLLNVGLKRTNFFYALRDSSVFIQENDRQQYIDDFKKIISNSDLLYKTVSRAADFLESLVQKYNPKRDYWFNFADFPEEPSSTVHESWKGMSGVSKSVSDPVVQKHGARNVTKGGTTQTYRELSSTSTEEPSSIVHESWKGLSGVSRSVSDPVVKKHGARNITEDGTTQTYRELSSTSVAAQSEASNIKKSGGVRWDIPVNVFTEPAAGLSGVRKTSAKAVQTLDAKNSSKRDAAKFQDEFFPSSQHKSSIRKSSKSDSELITSKQAKAVSSEELQSLLGIYKRTAQEAENLGFGQSTEAKLLAEKMKATEKKIEEEMLKKCEDNFREDIMKSEETQTELKNSDFDEVLRNINKTLSKMNLIEQGAYLKDEQCQKLYDNINDLTRKFKALSEEFNVRSVQNQFSEYSRITLSKLEELAKQSRNSVIAAEAQIAAHRSNAKNLSQKLKETEDLLRESINECLSLKQLMKQTEEQHEKDRYALIASLKEKLQNMTASSNEVDKIINELTTYVIDYKGTKMDPFVCTFCEQGMGHKMCLEKVNNLREEERRARTQLKILQKEAKQEKETFIRYQEIAEHTAAELKDTNKSLREIVKTLEAKNASLLERIKLEKNRIKSMERFRRLEIEGFQTDIKHLKTKIRDMEKQLLKAVLVFENNRKDLELLKTVHETAQRSKEATSALRRLKAKLYELETDIKSL